MAFEKIESRRTRWVNEQPTSNNTQNPVTKVDPKNAVAYRVVDRASEGKGESLNLHIGVNIMAKLGWKPEERVELLYDKHANVIKVTKNFRGYKLSINRKHKNPLSCTVNCSKQDSMKITDIGRRLLCQHEIDADGNLLVMLSSEAEKLPVVPAVKDDKKEMIARIGKNTASKATFSTACVNNSHSIAIRIGNDLIDDARMRAGDTVSIDFDYASSRVIVARSADSKFALKKVPESKHSLLLVANLSWVNMERFVEYTKASYFESAEVRADGAIILSLPATQINSNKVA